MIENKNKRLLIIILALESLLLIPMIAMQFTTEADWSYFDFLIFGVILLIVGLVAELILRKIKRRINRIKLIAFLVIAFLLLWIELAVGIFGSPIAGN